MKNEEKRLTKAKLNGNYIYIAWASIMMFICKMSRSIVMSPIFASLSLLAVIINSLTFIFTTTT